MRNCYTLQFDGLYRGVETDEKPPSAQAGFMCYGWVILKNKKEIARGHGGYIHGQNATSNTAEYLALIEGLEALRDLGLEHETIEVVGDARSVIEQMQGLSEVNAQRSQCVFQRARRLARHFTALTWTWAPRCKNHVADSLTRRALRQICHDPRCYHSALKSLQGQKSSQGQGSKFLSILDLRIYKHQRLAQI
jgi:ribonuclease HI